MPAYWYSPVAAALWQIMLHSFLAAAILLLWARRWRLPPGRARRQMLELILLLPLLTALIPGRGGFDFREGWVWLDSSRVLAIPIGWGLHVYHGVLAAAAVTVLVSLAQELLPALHRGHREPEAPPETLERVVRALPGWQRCRVTVSREPGLHVSTSGRPGRPRLTLSREVLALPDAELAAVLRHENAHWQRGRWWRTHLLFLARVVQLYNPVALWAFREHTVETEIACNAEAVGVRSGGENDDPRENDDGGEARRLARVLLRFYQDTARSAVAARFVLRRRVDVLLGRAPRPDEQPPPDVLWIAGALLLLGLPWIV